MQKEKEAAAWKIKCEGFRKGLKENYEANEVPVQSLILEKNMARFKFHFNLLRDVIGHFFVLVFIDHQARSVSRCWAPCVLLADIGRQCAGVVTACGIFVAAAVVVARVKIFCGYCCWYSRSIQLPYWWLHRWFHP